jgi:hypothetical protein
LEETYRVERPGATGDVESLIVESQKKMGRYFGSELLDLSSLGHIHFIWTLDPASTLQRTPRSVLG